MDADVEENVVVGEQTLNRHRYTLEHAQFGPRVRPAKFDQLVAVEVYAVASLSVVLSMYFQIHILRVLDDDPILVCFEPCVPLPLVLVLFLQAVVVVAVSRRVRPPVFPPEPRRRPCRREYLPVRVDHRHDHELHVSEKLRRVGVAGVEAARDSLGDVRRDRRRDPFARVLQRVQHQPLLPHRRERRARRHPDLQRRDRAVLVRLADRAQPHQRRQARDRQPAPAQLVQRAVLRVERVGRLRY